MLTAKKLRLILKNTHGIILGEKTLSETRYKIIKFSKAKLKISGRSCKTGKKMVKNLTFSDFLELVKK